MIALAEKIPGLAVRAKGKEDGVWEELSDLRLQLDTALNQFEMEEDGEVIEACCYKLKALSIQYSRLLREARRKGLQREPFSR